MALGIQGNTTGPTLVYRLLEDLSAAAADPDGAVAQFRFSELIAHPAKFIPEDVVGVKIFSTAGTGPLSCKGRLWARNTQSPIWTPIGIGTSVNKGVLNNTLPITGTVAIRHVEPQSLPLLFDEVFLQMTDLSDGGGGDMRLAAELIFERRRRH